ncbi:MAG: VCBS repeat-containing protein [Acidobacteria bacterium]|nr:VCBS repeat-containing protein [Acidobacteriota bacterium]
MKPSLLLVAATFFILKLAFASEHLPKFREQVIDDQLGDCWALTTADINGDGKSDVVAVSYEPARVVWYENPTWKRRLVVEEHPKMLATIQAMDVDGDGKVELIAGADYYEPLDTKRGGSVWLLQRPKNLDQPWTAIKIDEEPTLHNLCAMDPDGKGKRELVVSTLLAPNKPGAGGGASLYLLRRPANPFKDRWEREWISSDLHMKHGLWPVDWDGDGRQELLAAAREGVILFRRNENGAWKKQTIGEGYLKGEKLGSSEVAVGRLPGGKRYIAAVEPHHGHEAVIYTAPEKAGQLWKRKVLIENAGGHIVWPADLTGSGVDSLLLGFVGHYNKRPGVPILYVFHPLDGEGDQWDRRVLDNSGMPGEDGTCIDLNQDGRLDIVAAGLKKMKIYWNEGK